ncbi:DHA2 family efflux MFS transporter permease subunit [Microbacterium thalassium]|uniref:EmrB/QacA subfamily drug resistance transporter n=1 Tax=Microbacterium thalassium TaxID=362649 RepID=A0A7X0FSN0_9MICO|nr:DHA2 family efflux MFS transporter permease subunit [Microbacterium thalassium]MBB6392990.1 EmrB/QacA subfamily drug resistance transporter [Microbacterium thalassium]GLK22778.1 MFS transporter [Microbacterium thalassium]
MSASAPERLGRQAVVTLIALSMGVFVVANDFTALSVAVPSIQSDLDTTLNRVQWVINGYTVVFGVLIVTGGRLADLLGRRRVFLIGAAIFGTFSLLGGLAPNIGLLIAARALMGIGGAMMWPSVLGMTYDIVPKNRSGLAGGLVIGVAGLGNSIGPLLGGVLTDLLDWRWIFFVNVPVALVTMLVVRRNVPESSAGARARVDYLGIASLSAAVVMILVALDIGTAQSFGSPSVVTMMVIGVVLLPLFVLVERRQGDDALVPPRVVASRDFAGALVSIPLLGSVFFGILVYVPQYLENELDWSAFAAGAGLLPMMLVFGGVSFLAGPLYHRVGGRRVVIAGASCLAVGATLLAVLMGNGYGPLVPGLVLCGVGVGLYFSAITTVAVTSVGPADSSLAGGIVYMANVAGGSVGLGINTAVVLAAAAVTTGIRNAFILDAALAVAATIVVALMIRDRPAHATTR